MVTKRRLRFSIGAMLVLMAGVAVLLNHEVQRATAIEITVKRLEDWSGIVNYRPRANMPSFLTSLLPESWSVEIDSIVLIANSSPSLEDEAFLRDNFTAEDEFSWEDFGVVDPLEVNRVIELGALDQMTQVVLDGTVFSHAVLSRLCRSNSMKKCFVVRNLLTDPEIEDLKRTFPHCKFDVIE